MEGESREEEEEPRSRLSGGSACMPRATAPKEMWLSVEANVSHWHKRTGTR